MFDRRIYLVLSLIVVASATTQSQAGRLAYRLQVFRIMDGVQTELQLRDKIWAAGDETWEKTRPFVTLFDRGQFRMGKETLAINEYGCFWNGQKIHYGKAEEVGLPQDRIRVIIDRGDLVRREHELLHVNVSFKQPFQFFEPRADGLFDLRETEVETGMAIFLKGDDKSHNRILLKQFRIEMRAVRGREKVPGVGFPVGRPLVRDSAYDLCLRVAEARQYGILLTPEDGSGGIIVRFQVDD